MVASFKQQCPSCEAMVLVKDLKQVGKKVDCPRCKYRFVVETPTEEAAVENGEGEILDEAKTKPKSNQAVTTQKPGAAAVPPTIRKKAGPRKGEEDEGAKAKKKKQKSSGAGVLILGIGVSVCAVGLLGVGGYLMFFSPKDDTKRGIGRTTVRFTRSTGDTAPKKIEETPALVEMTNLLPNDTQGILYFNFQNLENGAVGGAAFGTPGGFSHEFVERRFGLRSKEVDRVLVAQNFTEDWVFVVIRTSQPIKLPELTKSLHLKFIAGSIVEGQDFYTMERSEWLDHIGQVLGGFYPDLVKAARPLRLREPRFRMVDSQTLVIADEKPLKAFLAVKSKPKPIAPKEEPEPSKTAATKTYATISPELKTLMERAPSSLISFAWEVGPIQQQMEHAADMLKRTGLADEKVINLIRGLRAVGGSLHLGKDMEMSFGLIGKDGQFAKDMVQQLRDKVKEVRQKGTFPPGQVQFEFDGQSLTAPPADQPAVLKDANVPAPDLKVSVRTTRAEKLLVLNAAFHFNIQIRDAIVKFLQPRMLILRGITDMVDAPSRIHELAAAAVALAAKGGGFPRGSYNRPIDAKRLGRPFPPTERVSWMAELLPYLGYASVHQQIKFNDSWKSSANAVPGSVLVPAFLGSDSPPNSWWVRLPYLGGRLYGTTHFVGVAGVGLDAADYATGDKTVANKLGIMGYDRQTKLADIKDGASNTILMLQVPPIYQRPWIAGGGATLTGVPETNSIRPFVSTYGDKRGTYAIMADGSVRFLSEKISDEAFKAMCTANGDEKVNIDQEAPRVGTELKVQPLKP